ncbi:phosphate regulon transcriptional regulator PhoB [Spirabiliibacterium falconis]|uniref:phosphate regulon transcriptional regulator PhoB n=1 Tax=Spirabiliibacterium falconis TaxID=572023 RepID=UPI001F40E165
MIALVLSQQGYHVSQARDYQHAQQRLVDNPDLILLDWMLPGRSGLQFLQYLKQHIDYASIPVIMLTAKIDEADCIAGLNTGADDYITKPFSPKTLLARLNAVLRRAGITQHQPQLNIDGLTVNIDSHRIHYQQHEIHLSTTEFKLLCYFMTHPEKVHSREKLLDRVWGNDIYVEDRTVDVYVRRLRKNLEPYGFHRYIQTVRSAGYRFSKPCENL